MAETAYIQRGDIGVDVDIPVTERDLNGTPDAQGNYPLVPTDLSNATDVQYRFRQPDGTVVPLPGAVHGDPTGGVLRCTTDNTVFTVDGEWDVFAVVTLTGGKQFSTRVRTFTVGGNY